MEINFYFSKVFFMCLRNLDIKKSINGMNDPKVTCRSISHLLSIVILDDFMDKIGL